MNKNKKFFSYGLFKEGFRQTRIIGLVGLITILAITALIWFGKFADSFNYIEKINKAQERLDAIDLKLGVKKGDK